MPQLPHHVAPLDRERVVACLREVVLARARLRAARHRPERQWDRPALREDLLASLERYAAAIVGLGVPMPRKLKAEIELYRALRNRA